MVSAVKASIIARRSSLGSYSRPAIATSLAIKTYKPVNRANDYWEVALRYAGEFNGVRIAAGVGYRHEDYTLDAAGLMRTTKLTSGWALRSVMHMPTGLFVSGGLAQGWTLMWLGEQTGFWVMAGIEKNFFGPGTTTLFGEYSEHNYNDVAEVAFDNRRRVVLGAGRRAEDRRCSYGPVPEVPERRGR